MCEEIATSREHVPPLCLFPEAKDVMGLKFRNNLITVPSCDKHNSCKSKDDEFLMVSIASIVGNNFLGYLQTQTKVDRALRRKSKDFLSKEVVRNFKHEVVKSKTGKKYPVLYGNPNYERLTKCFEHIAFGIYLHEHGEKFSGQIRMLLGFVDYSDSNTKNMLGLVKEKFQNEEKPKIVKGSNPSIFKYQFFEPDEFGLIGLIMTFYDGTEVFIAFQPSTFVDPKSNLAIELIKHGIPTFIEVGNRKFEFNIKSK
ncbi:hypothetical protein V3Q90_01055 [Flavobacterium oreochromis]